MDVSRASDANTCLRKMSFFSRLYAEAAGLGQWIGDPPSAGMGFDFDEWRRNINSARPDGAGIITCRLQRSHYSRSYRNVGISDREGFRQSGQVCLTMSGREKEKRFYGLMPGQLCCGWLRLAVAGCGCVWLHVASRFCRDYREVFRAQAVGCRIEAR